MRAEDMTREQREQLRREAYRRRDMKEYRRLWQIDNANKLANYKSAKARRKQELLGLLSEMEAARKEADELKGNDTLRENRKQIKQRLIEYKGGKCAHCNGVFPACVYDFHHTNPEEKEYNLSQLVGLANMETVLRELDKCILLCANCHRIHHHARDAV